MLKSLFTIRVPLTLEVSQNPLLLMLSRSWRRNGAFSHSILFKTFLSSHFSSNPNSSNNALNPRSTKRRPTQIPTNFRFAPSVSSSPQISDTLITSDVNLICSVLSTNGTESNDLETLLNEFKAKLSSELVLQVLMNYRQLGRIRTLEFFSWAGIQMGFQFDDSVVEYMADFLGRRKLFDDLKCFLVTVSTNNHRVSPRTLSICIRFLGRQGRVKEALCLFEEMESTFNCKPDNLVYNNMLYVLCKKEYSEHFIDVAITIFRRIECPDTYSYSNILVGLCKFRQFDTALELFRDMGRACLVPTRSAVNVLIGELCSMSSKDGAIERVKVNHHRRPFTILVPNVSAKSGAIEPATAVFWAVNELGVLPSAFVVTMLITELCRLGRMREAIDILKIIEERKLRILEECYSIVIKSLCEQRWVDEVSQLFGKMLSLNFKPKSAVYNSMICMFCKLGSLVEAERVFKIMTKKRCTPDAVTYTGLIHAYCEVQNWEAAYELLMEMLGLGWNPHFHTYSLVDKILRENNQMDLCIKLERKMEMQILQNHCKEGRLEAAYEKLGSMVQKGIYPPMYVREAFERAFQKCGKLRIARELLEGIDREIHENDDVAIRCRDQL